jgi:hypothetical protein
MSAEQVKKAAALYSTGLSVAAVADSLGANSSHVWRVLKREGVPTRDSHGRQQ